MAPWRTVPVEMTMAEMIPNRPRGDHFLASPGVALGDAYGWDGGRIGTTLVSGEATLAVPLSGLSGRRSFTISTLAGPEARASEGWVTATSTGVRGDQPEAAQAAPLPPPPAP